jgi:hypothetical protein
MTDVWVVCGVCTNLWCRTTYCTKRHTYVNGNDSACMYQQISDEAYTAGCVCCVGGGVRIGVIARSVNIQNGNRTSITRLTVVDSVGGSTASAMLISQMLSVTIDQSYFANCTCECNAV